MTAEEVAEIAYALPVEGAPMFALLLHVAEIGGVEMRLAAGGRNALSRGFDRGLELWRTDDDFRAAYNDGVRRLKAFKQDHGIA